MGMKEKFALGVLMGCLITGNMAWAGPSVNAVLDINDGSNKQITDDGFDCSASKEPFHRNTIAVTNNSSLNVDSKTINIGYTSENNTNDACYELSAVLTSNGGSVVLGNSNNDNITIKANSFSLEDASLKQTDIVNGIHARRKAGREPADSLSSKVVVASKNFNLDVHGSQFARGLYAWNNTSDKRFDLNGKTVEEMSQIIEDADTSKIIVNADNIKINVTTDYGDKGSAEAIAAWSNGIVDINGNNIEITAQNLITTRGDSIVTINKDTRDAIIKLTGDILFDYSTSSGTTIDSNVVINLNNSQSFLNGNIHTSSNINPIPDGKDNVDGIQLGLSNGGTWNTDKDSFVNNLTFDGGVINVNGGADQTIQIDNVAGNGGDINIKGELDNGVWKLGKVVLGKEDNSKVEGKIDLNLSGVTADDIEDSKAALDALAGSLSVEGNGDKLDATGNIKEGLISGGISSDFKVDENGNVSVDKGTIQQGTSTTTMDSMRDIAGVAIAAWRQEDSSLGQRLGELRSSEGDQGIWTRMSRGEFEYNGNFKNQYNFFQLGYDKAYGDWHYGAAISHNDGKTNYANGSGENSSTSLSLYGTWLGNDGEYADIVLKQGRLNNEFDIVTAAGRTTGDYDMWGTSLSGEYGKEIKLNDGWYVTPQGQLTLMYIGGEDYTTNNGIRAEQDSMTSLVGRVGFEMGKAVNDKGRIFAKASLLHDFNGEADTRLTLGDKHNSYTQDLGETWYEAGIGISYKVSKASYIYADVMKTFGGDLETPWQWNAGVRYSF